MKNLVISAMAFLSIVSSSFAEQPNLAIDKAISTAVRTSFIDANHSSLQGVTNGNISVDFRSQTITLAAYRPFYCPPHLVCAQVMPAPVVITLPITNRFVDECGSITYTAEKDQRPVDGALQQLLVIDNTDNRCPTFQALAPTEVQYHTEIYGFSPLNSRSVHMIKGTSYFTGQKLL